MADQIPEILYSPIKFATELKRLPVEKVSSTLDGHLFSAPDKRAFLHFVEFSLLRWFESADELKLYSDAPWRVIAGRWVVLRNAVLDKAELEVNPDILAGLMNTQKVVEQVLAHMPQQDEKFVNQAEGGKLLGMTRQSFAKLRDAKVFPEYRPTSRKPQYKVSDLMAYMESRANLKGKAQQK